MFRGSISLPFFIGIIALLWLSLAVYFSTRFFGVSKKYFVAIISAIMATNLTITSQASGFMYEFDFDMLALLFSILAACCWKKGGKAMWFCPVFVFLTLGIYQAYISVTIAFLMIHSILALAESPDAKAKPIILKGLLGIAFLFIGAAVYAACLLTIPVIFNISIDSGGENSLTKLVDRCPGDIITLIKETIAVWVKQVLLMYKVKASRLINLICFILLSFIPIIPVCFFFKKKTKFLNLILIGVLIALLPLGMNCIWIINGGYVHYLMKFSFWFAWLIPLLLTDTKNFKETVKTKSRKMIKFVIVCCVAILVFTHIRTANTVYVKKDLERQATLSVMTDVTRLMNDTEGYIPSETPITFVGQYNKNRTIYGFEELCNLTGSHQNTSVTYVRSYENYCRYILNTPICVVELTEGELNSEIIKTMPCYPDKNCVKFVGDVLVVKFSD